ncbi:site-specific integrase [Mucilaginibacter sp. ZT4R22]|uniref:Site-specific integrase n=1 Tax=Mucilaginibacter pankratovii TaxID=2772110 RepID=A0ABR7WZ41_9SPHI|nr:site-specific integrase [Mucilaginibacter pankratovii]MBD1367542.1 site-specific integrase [Mucilaginibacter pankratovii]
MLEKSFGLLFYLKQSKTQKKGPLYIYLKITVDGKSVELSSKRKWETAKWSSSAARAVGTREDARELNHFLDALELRIFQAKRSLIEADREVSAQVIKDILTGNVEKRKKILEVFTEHNAQMKALQGVDFAPSTMQRYSISYNHTRDFIKWKYRTDDRDIKDLDHEFISQYAFWLKTVRNCDHNTTMKYLVNFKKIVLICVRNKWLPGDPFSNFKLTRKTVERTALTDIELQRIAEKNFENVRLSNVRDIFLFSCYTGLAYVDVKNLKREDIQTGVDGELWVFINRQKTNALSKIPLLPEAMDIIKKYNDHPKCIINGVVLPVLTNQKMNSYLKEIADCCAIQMELTYHIARHTFATTVTLSNGVPIETVSKMLGHATIKQTQHYAKTLDLKVSEDMNRLKKRMVRKGQASA